MKNFRRNSQNETILIAEKFAGRRIFAPYEDINKFICEKEFKCKNLGLDCCKGILYNN